MKTGIILFIIGFITQFISAQSLVSVTPNSANAGQTLDITITGAGTHFTQGSTTVSISLGAGPGVHVNSWNASDNLNLHANVTVATYAYTGEYDVSVYNTTDGYLSLYDAFHVNGIPIPSLVSVSPSSGNASQTLDITITGANTHFTSGSNTTAYFEFLQGSPTAVNSLTISDELHLTANVTIPTYTYTGSYDVGVYNTIDGWKYLYNSFYVNGIAIPSLSNITPASANAGQTLDVTITGTNTHFLSGSGTTIDFEFDTGSPTVINSVTISSDLILTANITVPNNTITGYYDVGVYNSIDHWLFLYNYFHINSMGSPQLVSVFPSSANAGQTLDVTITGANTHFLSASNTYIDFNTPTPTIINSYYASDELHLITNITIPSNTPTGDYDLNIDNSIDLWLYLNNAIHINCLTCPQIISVVPNIAGAGQTLNVTFTGANTHFLSGINNFVIFEFDTGDTTVINSITVMSETSLVTNITIPYSTPAGWYDVLLWNCVDEYINLYSGFGVGMNSVDVYANEVCNFSVLENPVQNKLQIKADVPKQDKVKIFLADRLGKLSDILYEGMIERSEILAINLSPYCFSPGLYLLRIEYEGRQFLYKIIIIK